MAKCTPSPLISSISGNIGGITFKQTKNGLTVSRTTNPSHTPSQSELQKRTIFSQARNMWKQLTPERKKAWQQLALSLLQTSTTLTKPTRSAYNLFTRFITFTENINTDPNLVPIPQLPSHCPRPSKTYPIAPNLIIQNIKQLTASNPIGIKHKIKRHASIESTYKSGKQTTTYYIQTQEKSINLAQQTPEKTINHQPSELLTVISNYHKTTELPQALTATITQALPGFLTIEDFETYPFTEWTYNNTVITQSSEQHYTGTYSLKWQYQAPAATQFPITLNSNILPYPTPPILVRFFLMATENPRAVLIIPTYKNSHNYTYLSFSYSGNQIAVVEYRNGTLLTLASTPWTNHPLNTWLECTFSLTPTGTLKATAKPTNSPQITQVSAQIQTLQGFKLDLIPTNLANQQTTYFLDTISYHAI